MLCLSSARPALHLRTRGSLCRFKPKRDPGIHSERRGATAGGSALYSRLLCEGLRSLSEAYCARYDTDSIHEEDGISRAKIFPVSLFFFLFLFLPSRCGSLSPRRSIGRQAFGGGVAVAEAGEAAGSWPLTYLLRQGSSSHLADQEDLLETVTEGLLSRIRHHYWGRPSLRFRIRHL